MAATVLGLTLTFGVPTLASLVVQSNNFREAVSIAEVQDEDGDFVSAALYGRKVTGTVEAVDNGFTTALGTVLDNNRRSYRDILYHRKVANPHEYGFPSAFTRGDCMGRNLG